MVRRPPLHPSQRSQPGAQDGHGMAGEAHGAARRARTEATTSSSAQGVKRFLVVLALLGSIQLVVMLGVEAYRAVEAERAIARLHIDIASLEAEAAALAAVVEHADDHDYREQLARRRGFVYPDEVRIVPVR